MDTPAKRRKLAGQVIPPGSPSSAPMRAKSPSKQRIPPPGDDFMNVENPFGTRSRVVGGERFPVRGDQATDDFMNVEDPFGQRSRVVGGERFPVRGNQGNSYLPPDSPQYGGKMSTATSKETERAAPPTKLRNKEGIRTKELEKQQHQLDRVKEREKEKEKEKEADRPSRKSTSLRPQKPAPTTSEAQIQQEQQQQQQSQSRKLRRSIRDSNASPGTKSRRRETEQERSQQERQRQSPPPPQAGSQPSQTSRSRQLRDASPTAAAERRAAKRDSVNSQPGTPSKRKKQKTGRKSSVADAIRTPLQKELDLLFEVLTTEQEKLQNDIAELDEELLVQKTAASLSLGGDESSAATTVDDLDGLIYNLLRINDEGLRPVLQQQQQATRNTAATAMEIENEIPSARPLHASTTLFHLEALSPLKFISIVSENETARDGALIRKSHFKGYSHEKLLYFEALLMVDPAASPPSVRSIDLSISDWARPELYGFLSACAPDRNICNMLYSLGSYCELARSRAMTWSRVEEEHPELLRGTEVKGKAITRDSHSASKEFDGLSRVNVVSYLPQQCIKLSPTAIFAPGNDSTTEPELVVQWVIEMDVSGEARSRITADVRTPETWVDEDSIDTIRNIPNTFKALTKEKGVAEAIFSLVEILFSKE